MATIHNALRRTALSRALTRALGDMKGEGGLERFGETLTPVIDLWSQPEWAVMRDEVPWARGLPQAAVAGEFSAVALVNPAGSGALVMVDRASVTGSGAVTLSMTTQAAIVATLGAAAVLTRDQRARVTNSQPPVPQIWFGSDAVSLIAAGFVLDRLSVEGPFTCGVPFVLMPGFALFVQGEANLQAIAPNFAGRVRTAYPGELL